MNQPFLDQINAHLAGILENSPFKDMEKNIKSVILAIFSKLDLVTREEFDTQTKVLNKTREKLEELEAILADINKKK